MAACSSEEAMTKIPHKVSASLAQVLEKLDLSKKAQKEKLGQCVELSSAQFLQADEKLKTRPCSHYSWCKNDEKDYF